MSLGIAILVGIIFGYLWGVRSAILILWVGFCVVHMYDQSFWWQLLFFTLGLLGLVLRWWSDVLIKNFKESMGSGYDPYD